MKTGKIIALALIISLLAGIFAGCFGGENPYDGQNPGDDYEVNIDMSDEDYNQVAELTIGITADKYERDLVDALAADFKDIFPNVTITPVVISGANYISAIGNRYETKTVPDIFFTSEKEAFSFISDEMFLNLKPYIKAENLSANPDISKKGFESMFVEEAWKIGQESYGGDQYFVPRSSDRIVAHLNTKHLKDTFAYWNSNAPVDKRLPEDYRDIVKNGWTWEDFLKVCEAARSYYDSRNWYAAGDYYLIDHSFSWEPVMFSLLKSFGATIAEGDTFVFDSPGTVAAAEAVRDLVTKGYIGPKGKGANYEIGRGLMLFHTSSAITKYNTYIKEDYDIVTFPVINGDDGVFGYGVPGYGIFSGIQTEKRDLAWQFLRYLLSEDGQESLAKAGMNTPSVRNDLQDYNTASWGEGLRHLNLGATTYQTYRNYTENFFLNFEHGKKDAITSVMGQFMENITSYDKGKFLLTVQKSIDECKNNVQRELNKI